MRLKTVLSDFKTFKLVVKQRSTFVKNEIDNFKFLVAKKISSKADVEVFD